MDNDTTLSDKLSAFNAGKLPEMIRLKYEAMAENAFRFFRGTCQLFYDYLSKAKLPRSPLCWTCGDLHLENYGSYKADNKLVYFDLNDFDESILAPALWEVLRVVTSIFVAFYALDINEDQAVNLAALFIRTYSLTLSRGKAVSIEPRTAKGIVRDFLKGAEKSGYKHLMEKRTVNKKHAVVLDLKDERHFPIEPELKTALCDHINDWIKTGSDGPYNYKVEDAVFRLAGTGSIGVKRYLFLLKSTNTKNRYLLLDMKQSFPSALAPYLRVRQPDWESEAHRIIGVQQRMQHMSASLLSATIFQGEPYVLQELQPVKDTLRFKMIKDDYRDLYQVIDDMAVLTASSQLRSGGMDGSAIIDELKAFGSDISWQQQALEWAQNHSQVVKKDYKQFKRELKRKRLMTNGDKKSYVKVAPGI